MKFSLRLCYQNYLKKDDLQMMCHKNENYKKLLKSFYRGELISKKIAKTLFTKEMFLPFLHVSVDHPCISSIFINFAISSRIII